MWYRLQFDQSWVRCNNMNCRAEFTLKFVERKRKCPRCKMDNKQQLPPLRDQPR